MPSQCQPQPMGQMLLAFSIGLLNMFSQRSRAMKETCCCSYILSVFPLALGSNSMPVQVIVCLFLLFPEEGSSSPTQCSLRCQGDGGEVVILMYFLFSLGSHLFHFTYIFLGSSCFSTGDLITL